VGILDNIPIIPIPGLPPITPGMADSAVPDKKVKLSELIGRYTDWDVRVATAITLAESRGRVDATHRNSDGSTDHGLMQINDKAHPGYDTHKLDSDPVYNIEAGHTIWREAGGKFTPWTTYTSGAYKLWLGHDATVTADKRTLLNPGDALSAAGDVVGGVGDGLTSIGHVFGALLNPSTWLRVGKGALGGVFIVVGVTGITYIIANKAAKSPVGKAAAKAAIL
jgi:hypothetical protein